MKLAFVDLCGFRGYQGPIRIDFADGFNVIDGRNGVGKSTIFDAIEFALTGTLDRKYKDAKADGETIADYLWWSGGGAVPTEHYVEVGFHGDDAEFVIRRTQFTGPDNEVLNALAARVCDLSTAPPDPLAQLCISSIIRDEHITALSLDLNETDRYILLRDALGATDASAWIERGNDIVALAKRRASGAQQDVTKANVAALRHR